MARKPKQVREHDADANTPSELFSPEPEQADAPSGDEPTTDKDTAAGSDDGAEGPSGGPQQETSAEGAAPEQATQPAQQPEEPVYYEFSGQRYTRDQLTDEKLRDIEQTLRQFPHVQRLHAEDKQKIEALMAENAKYREALARLGQPQPQQAAAQQAQETKPITPEEWMKARSETVQKLVKGGWLTQDSVDLAPDMAALIAGIAEAYFALAQRNDAFESAVVSTYQQNLYPLIRSVSEAAEFQQVSGFLNQLDSTLAEIGESGPHFEGLKDPQNRMKFVEHLAKTVDPDIERLQGPQAKEFLTAQYIAYNQAAILDAIAKATASASAKPTPPVTSPDVTGEGGSPRRPSVVGQQNADIAAIFSKG